MAPVWYSSAPYIISEAEVYVCRSHRYAQIISTYFCSNMLSGILVVLVVYVVVCRSGCRGIALCFGYDHDEWETDRSRWEFRRHLPPAGVVPLRPTVDRRSYSNGGPFRFALFWQPTPCSRVVRPTTKQWWAYCPHVVGLQKFMY